MPLLVFLLLLPFQAEPIDTSQIAEPPIPIYFVCPYHQDSLQSLYGAGPAGMYRSAWTASADSQRTVIHEAVQTTEGEVRLLLLLLAAGIVIQAVAAFALLRAQRRLTDQVGAMQALLMRPALPPPVEEIPVVVPSAPVKRRPASPRKPRAPRKPKT